MLEEYRRRSEEHRWKMRTRDEKAEMAGRSKKGDVKWREEARKVMRNGGKKQER